MLRDIEVIRKLYDSREEYVKMSSGQEKLIQMLVDEFVDQVNHLSSLRIGPFEEPKYSKFMKTPEQLETASPLETLRKYFATLIDSYSTLILPFLTNVTINNLSQ